MSNKFFQVGEIVQQKDKCFWIFFSDYIYDEECTICSPWFSLEGELWRLVKDPYRQVKNYYGDDAFEKTFRLWTKFCSAKPKRFTVQVSLNANVTEVYKRTQDLHSDYGCSFTFTNLKPCTTFSENKQVKVFIDIQRKENTDNAKINKNVVPKNYDENSTETEESDEDDDSDTVKMSSEEKYNNKRVTFFAEDILFAKNDEVTSTEDEESSEDEDRKNVKMSNEEKYNNEYIITEGIDKLLQDLKSLLLNEQNSDVTLKVQDCEFKVHRNILTIRSPVFASLLQHDTKENTTDVLDIPDCSAEAFKVFLSYVYTGKLDTITSDNVFDLYYAADKYEIEDLKTECVKYLEKNVCIENFCAVLPLSLLYNEPCLQEKATQFFCDNVNTVLERTKWLEFLKDYPETANELFKIAFKVGKMN